MSRSAGWWYYSPQLSTPPLHRRVLFDGRGSRAHVFVFQQLQYKAPRSWNPPPMGLCAKTMVVVSKHRFLLPPRLPVKTAGNTSVFNSCSKILWSSSVKALREETLQDANGTIANVHPIVTVCWISVPNSLPYLYRSIILGLNSVINVGVGFLMYLLVFLRDWIFPGQSTSYGLGHKRNWCSPREAGLLNWRSWQVWKFLSLSAYLKSHNIVVCPETISVPVSALNCVYYLSEKLLQRQIFKSSQ